MVRLNRDQVKQLADFTSNLSLVYLASTFAVLFSDVDTIDLIRVIWGLVAAFLMITTRLLLLRRKEK